jgi:hypothetical protein
LLICDTIIIDAFKDGLPLKAHPHKVRFERLRFEFDILYGSINKDSLL